MSEITNLLRSILIARGQEAVERLKTGYLPSVGCPPETAADFMTQLQSLDAKGFRRWLTDFIKLVPSLLAIVETSISTDISLSPLQIRP